MVLGVYFSTLVSPGECSSYSAAYLSLNDPLFRATLLVHAKEPWLS
ncbi:MAG: hypothetical protein Ct9H300mP25_13650 [Acidobacteriota bacterium]|nr:MAG: hypothetical protein Ct9H300mP25_13650 [Acidobacteriota bacterium]